MTATLDYLSDILRDLQRELNDNVTKQGFIQFDRLASLSLISSISKMADYAKTLENAFSQAEWNRRAMADRAQLLCAMNAASAEVLQLMRPDANAGDKIIQFRPRTKPASGPTAPPGGDAA